MTSATKTATFVTLAAGLLGGVLLLGLPPAAAQARDTDSTRAIDVRLSRFAFSPERIEAHVGERLSLNVIAVDAPHGFEVKALGVKARTPARGRTVTVELTPTQAGTFPITCSEYCGSGHSRMKAWLIVTPGT